MASLAVAVLPIGEDNDLVDRLCGLSKMHRLWGFGICFVLGLCFSILSIFLLSMFMISLFVILFTVGNVLSPLFLVGPLKQLKVAFASVRIVATLIYLASMAGTLYCALKLHNLILTIICCILQFGTLFWYSLSYIPFARGAVKYAVKEVV